MQLNLARCTVSRLGLVDYQEAWRLQQRLVEECRRDHEPRLLLLEHPPTYTLGVRAKADNLLANEETLRRLGATVERIDRGGDVTFHGPGQLVGYPILDLNCWGQGPLWYVRSLEAVLIETLKAFDIDSERRPGRPGVWIGNQKIASIGVRVSRGITSHGFALNLNTDLSYFTHIVPCGIPDVTMTSVAATGLDFSVEALMDAVVQSFATVFELEMQDGERTVAPAEWTLAMAL